jgi:hypothetical protein
MRLVHWYLTGIRGSTDLAEQRRLLQQVYSSLRIGFEREESSLCATGSAEFAERQLAHQRILEGIERLLHSRIERDEAERQRLLHAMDELVVLKIGLETSPTDAELPDLPTIKRRFMHVGGAWQGAEALVPPAVVKKPR